MMNSRVLSTVDRLRTFAVIFETGDDPVDGLNRFAREHAVTGAQLTGLGAFREVVVGYFDPEQKDYRRLRFDEQMEVLTLIGNIGLKAEEPALHVHVVLGRADGTAHGGHLLQATVRPTLEVIVTETPRHLRRTHDPETKLHLIDPRL